MMAIPCPFALTIVINCALLASFVSVGQLAVLLHGCSQMRISALPGQLAGYRLGIKATPKAKVQWDPHLAHLATSPKRDCTPGFQTFWDPLLGWCWPDIIGLCLCFFEHGGIGLLAGVFVLSALYLGHQSVYVLLLLAIGKPYPPAGAVANSQFKYPSQ